MHPHVVSIIQEKVMLEGADNIVDLELAEEALWSITPDIAL